MAVYREEGHEELLKTCPYDKNHRVSERRFQFHVQYCTANQSLVRCQFNSLHVYPKDQEAQHMSTCADFASHYRAKMEGQAEDLRKQLSGDQKQQQQPPVAAAAHRRYEWDEAVEQNPAGQGNRTRAHNSAEATTKQEKWDVRCFRPDGSLISPLGTVGLSRLTAEERSQYYQMLTKAGRMVHQKQAAAAAAGGPVQQTGTVTQEPDEWGSGPGSAAVTARAGLMRYAQNLAQDKPLSGTGRGSARR